MDLLSPDAERSAATGSVKSEDSTPPHEGGRGSPPPNCAICLGTCRNKCFTDSCLHQFCFKCLLTWSKVKAECPLCKQNFKSIIHNVRSNHQYEEYMVEQRVETIPDPAVDLSNATRRFRYRTTLTLPRRDTLAIQHLLMHYPMMAGVLPPPSPSSAAHVHAHAHAHVHAHAGPVPGPPPRRRRRSPNSFRRTVYRHNLWARPLPDFTGRYRDCSPEFYRRNDSQIHRLVPWLSRELHYLLNENAGHISYVMARLLELLPQHHITSAEFAAAVQRYFGDRTEHFLHELHCFASTPYDMAGYDRQVQYTTDTRISTVVNEISSTDSDSDSDIVMVSSSAPHPEPPPGPSRPPAPGVVPIETVSHSGTDDDEEVVVVGYIKPPADRTPEVVDLVGSDSDVVVQEAPEPERNLVKLSLTRRRVPSDSDSSYVPEPEERPKRKRRARSVSTTDSERLTPSPPPAPALPPPPPPTPPPPTPPPECDASSAADPSSSSDSEDRRRRNPKRARRKSRKGKKRSKKSPPRHRERRKVSDRPEHESRHGHGVKSSRRPEEPEPGPSTSRASRLRSVVNVPAKSSDSSSSGPSNLLNLLSSAILNPRSNVLAYNSDGGSAPDSRRALQTERLLWRADSCFKTESSGSDPEDDLPLNLSVQRSHPL
ncbi:E3 ubiquitin-protein ligase Topors-like [Cydia strobilella]|uniref:E3 ubiquitin-protein ligase Topors-like n=1 Tax=Cydia strobilella TaxID=1100964 RepID=UPI0030058E38